MCWSGHTGSWLSEIQEFIRTAVWGVSSDPAEDHCKETCNGNSGHLLDGNQLLCSGDWIAIKVLADAKCLIN